MSIPIGFCQCGCGQRTAVCPYNNATMGHVKGQPFKFIKSHNRRITRRSYIRRRVAGQSIQEHVAVAERALGKALPLGAQVHHVDEDKRNNATGNLVICQDQGFHYLLHVRARVVRVGGDPNTERLCAVCNSLKPFAEFNRGQSQCRACQAVYFASYVKRKKGRAA